jgi:hypothetical protein
LTPNPCATIKPQPHTGQANYNDGRSNRAGRDVWEPIAVHVATRSGIMQRCKASEEVTVPGGYDTSPSAVAGRYAT